MLHDTRIFIFIKQEQIVAELLRELIHCQMLISGNLSRNWNIPTRETFVVSPTPFIILFLFRDIQVQCA